MRTTMEDIIFKIDAEIARLKEARALLSAAGTAVTRRKPGRPPKAISEAVQKAKKPVKRRKMSAEARERIRQAQIKRWAAQKGSSKASLNAAGAPLSKAKKKVARAA